MKAILFSFLFAVWAMAAMGQKSQYFDYDRNRVSSMMEAINEESVTRGISCLPFGEGADSLPKGRAHYFWTGALGGCIGSLAGTGIGYLGGEELGLGAGFGLASLALGALAGIAVPQIVIQKRTDQPGKARSAAACGSASAIGTGVLCIIVLFWIGEG